MIHVALALSWWSFGVISATAFFILIAKLGKLPQMALDFTGLTAQTSLAAANAAALQTQAANSSDAANQAEIDAATQSLEASNAITTSLLPPAPAPAEPEAPAS